eukprot:gnl/TRDRNA2_/TRDRNA2_35189_c0_seq2.p1 gnl/TRDRNA2_/TRDRNA2_35189_c0~~gnl/TRDRNA2_/TRDRNA2_35189_c0_seq2.p1  ORF type:complete len:168 (-),score=22.47 gnl/TRDRNA2_/TRDRNA2_35189_c0_seq2:56-487(-)
MRGAEYQTPRGWGMPTTPTAYRQERNHMEALRQENIKLRKTLAELTGGPQVRSPLPRSVDHEEPSAVESETAESKVVDAKTLEDQPSCSYEPLHKVGAYVRWQKMLAVIDDIQEREHELPTYAIRILMNDKTVEIREDELMKP